MYQTLDALQISQTLAIQYQSTRQTFDHAVVHMYITDF